MTPLRTIATAAEVAYRQMPFMQVLPIVQLVSVRQATHTPFGPQYGAKPALQFVSVRQPTH